MELTERETSPELKQINTTVSPDDYNYARKHNLKFSHMIRLFIRDHKVNANYWDAEPTAREMRRKVTAWQGLAEKQRQFITENGLIEKWLESQTISKE